MAAVNIAVTASHRAETRAEIRACHIEQWLAEGGSPGLIANQWREDVALLQKQAASYTDSFLALADIDAARNHSAAIKADELFFERARQQHPVKCLEKTLMRRRQLFSFRF